MCQLQNLGFITVSRFLRPLLFVVQKVTFVNQEVTVTNEIGISSIDSCIRDVRQAGLVARDTVANGPPGIEILTDAR